MATDEKIVIKAGDLESIQGVIKLGNLPLPVKTGYILARLIKKISAEAKTYHEERMKLVYQYCDRDEKGEPVLMNNDQVSVRKNMAIFNEKLAELQRIPVELSLSKIKMDLIQIPDGSLSAVDFIQIEPFVEIAEIGHGD